MPLAFWIGDSSTILLLVCISWLVVIVRGAQPAEGGGGSHRLRASRTLGPRQDLGSAAVFIALARNPLLVVVAPWWANVQ